MSEYTGSEEWHHLRVDTLSTTSYYQLCSPRLCHLLRILEGPKLKIKQPISQLQFLRTAASNDQAKEMASSDSMLNR